MSRTAVIIAAGTPPAAELFADLEDPVVIVADGGLAAARSLDLVPAIVVGDFDSAQPADLVWAEGAGADCRRFPTDKDYTDLELALEAALGAECGRLVVTGVRGGRPDHELSNVAALAGAARAGASIETRSGDEATMYVTSHGEIAGEIGSIVSLLPHGGDVVGITTEGLRWPLHGETLTAFASRGVSNEMARPNASVAIQSGLLLVVQPK